MLQILPMNESEFQVYNENGIAEYARVSPNYRDLPFEEAIVLARKENETKILPNGFKTEGHCFLTIRNDQKQIGYLHFATVPKGSTTAYFYNFNLDEAYRGQGLGKKSMELARDYLKGLGFKKVMLNVVANNTTAIKLYESFGFQTTQMNMERVL